MTVGDELRRPDGVVLSPVRTIRKHCVECMGGQYSEVPLCTAHKCWLYPYRMGKDPRRKKRSAKQIEAARRAATHARRPKVIGDS